MKPRTQRSHDAVRRGHSRLTTVTLRNLDGVIGQAPVYDGFVGFDLSKRDGARYGTLTVPGYDWWPLVNPSSVTWVEVTQTIEGESWDLGQFPVAAVELEDPGGLVTVQLEDWAARRARAVAAMQTDLLYGATVAEFFQHHASHVMPRQDFTVVADDTGGAAKPYTPRVPAGGDVWRAIFDLATAVGAVPLVTSLTTGELRVHDPYAPVHETVTGTVNRVRTGFDLGNVVNSVVMQVNSEDPDSGTFRAVKTIQPGTSPWAMDPDGVGYCILFDSETVPVASQPMADAKAQQLYDRRAGAVKAVSLRVVPQPWLEPGDVIAWQDGRGGTDRGVIDSIEYPLRADQVMNIRLRGVPVP